MAHLVRQVWRIETSGINRGVSVRDRISSATKEGIGREDINGYNVIERGVSINQIISRISIKTSSGACEISSIDTVNTHQCEANIMWCIIGFQAV